MECFITLKYVNIKWFRNVNTLQKENQETRKLTLLLIESKIVFGFHQTQRNAIYDAIIKKKHHQRAVTVVTSYTCLDLA